MSGINADDLTLSGCTLTSQDPRGFEQPILIHDGEHAREFFGGCLCAIAAIIACEFDKPKTMQAWSPKWRGYLSDWKSRRC